MKTKLNSLRTIGYFLSIYILSFFYIFNNIYVNYYVLLLEAKRGNYNYRLYYDTILFNILYLILYICKYDIVFMYIFIVNK